MLATRRVIKWVSIETPTERLAALRSGSVDLATRLTADALSAPERKSAVSSHKLAVVYPQETFLTGHLR